MTPVRTPARGPGFVVALVATTVIALLGLPAVAESLNRGAAATPRLTSANSIAFEFAPRRELAFAGTQCGQSVSATQPLPDGATGIKVVEPEIGDRNGGTRVTDVTVAGTNVTVTVVADGASVCDPEQTGVPAGEQVTWQAKYVVTVRYTRRVQATMRVYFESYRFGAKWALRPKTIRDTRRGGPPGLRVSGIRWKRFGGRTAVGFGTLRLDYCRRGDNCPQNGKRVRLVARNPDYCNDTAKIEYRDLDVYIGRLQWAGLRITCSQ